MAGFHDPQKLEATIDPADKQLRATMDALPIAITRCSKDFRYVRVGRTYAEWIGKKLEQIERSYNGSRTVS